MIAFLDTNILLDVLMARHPFYVSAAGIWTFAESRRFRAMISVISFNNIYYIVRKAAGKAKAIESMKLIRAVFEPVEMDAGLLDMTLASSYRDFEDALQFQSALSIKADYFVSRNPKDFPKTGPKVVSPEELLAIVSATDQMPKKR
jgi:predicted nucleic acid-binding protein